MAGERPGVSVHGISWELTEDARREAEQRARRAAADAVARAIDYPRPSGAGTPQLEHVYEACAPAGGQARVLQPGDVDVSVHLSADFVAM